MEVFSRGKNSIQKNVAIFCGFPSSRITPRRAAPSSGAKSREAETARLDRTRKLSGKLTFLSKPRRSRLLAVEVLDPCYLLQEVAFLCHPPVPMCICRSKRGFVRPRSCIRPPKGRSSSAARGSAPLHRIVIVIIIIIIIIITIQIIMKSVLQFHDCFHGCRSATVSVLNDSGRERVFSPSSSGAG